MEKIVFQGVIHAPSQEGGATASPNFSGPRTYALTVWPGATHSAR